MTKLPLKEIEEKIKAALETIDPDELENIKDCYGEQLDDILYGLHEEGDSVTKYISNIEHIDTDCCAGDGSEAYMVFKYSPTGQLFGLEGWYSSGEGYNWEEGFKEMEPFTVTHYKAK